MAVRGYVLLCLLITVFVPGMSTRATLEFDAEEDLMTCDVEQELMQLNSKKEQLDSVYRTLGAFASSASSDCDEIGGLRSSVTTATERLRVELEDAFETARAGLETAVAAERSRAALTEALAAPSVASLTGALAKCDEAGLDDALVQQGRTALAAVRANIAEARAALQSGIESRRVGDLKTALALANAALLPQKDSEVVTAKLILAEVEAKLAAAKTALRSAIAADTVDALTAALAQATDAKLAADDAQLLVAKAALGRATARMEAARTALKAAIVTGTVDALTAARTSATTAHVPVDDPQMLAASKALAEAQAKLLGARKALKSAVKTEDIDALQASLELSTAFHLPADDLLVVQAKATLAAEQRKIRNGDRVFLKMHVSGGSHIQDPTSSTHIFYPDAQMGSDSSRRSVLELRRVGSDGAHVNWAGPLMNGHAVSVRNTQAVDKQSYLFASIWGWAGYEAKDAFTFSGNTDQRWNIIRLAGPGALSEGDEVELQDQYDKDYLCGDQTKRKNNNAWKIRVTTKTKCKGANGTPATTKWIVERAV